MLNVGVIGLGVGQKHALAYAAHPGCRVHALCDFSPQLMDACAARHAGVLLYSNAQELLDNPEIDLVSIASYDNAHAEQVLHAVEGGKHVFVEKPVCLHENELQAIRASLEAHPSVRLSSNLNLRTCPRFAWVREQARANALGTLFAVEADYLWGRAHKLTDGWRGEQEFYSIIHGAAVHMIDLLLWITGKRPVRVQGVGNNISTRGSKMRFNDYAALLLTFDDGMVAKVTANAGCVHPHFHKLTVFGTAKTFVHDYYGARLYGKDMAEPVPVLEEYPGTAHKQQIIHSFVDSILDGDAPPLVTAEDVFAAMSVCLTAEQAVQCGTALDITYL